MKNKRTFAPLIITTFIFIGIIYLWFVSIGTWTKLSQSSTYFYRLLAEGFLAGSPALPIDPDPRLAQVENPYLRESHRNIPIFMDASYFKGKYYLYFGPVPSVMLAGIITIFKRGASDGYFTLFSGYFLFISSSLIIIKLWKNHFHQTPTWLLGLILVWNGMVYPLLWVLNTARIYEAAILTGAAFLMAGLYLTWDTLDGFSPKTMNLILASLFWGLAIGTRLVLVGAIIILGLAVIFRLYQNYRETGNNKQFGLDAAKLLIPFVSIIALLGWYNYIRFDSPFETGIKYALVGDFDIDMSKPGAIFNQHFIPNNLFNYLLNPFEINPVFPFIKSPLANNSLYKSLLHTEAGYSRANISGILLTIPATVFTLLFIWFAIGKIGAIKQADTFYRNLGVDKASNLVFSVSIVAIAASIVFIFLLNYFVISTRFYMDFLPMVNIVTIAGLWLGYSYFQKQTVLSKTIYSVVVILLMIYSIIIGFLLAITADLDRFQNFNPELFEKLKHIF
jgi:hypothetical protein